MEDETMGTTVATVNNKGVKKWWGKEIWTVRLERETEIESKN